MDMISQPNLIWCPHPLLATAGRQQYFEEFLSGESVGAYLERLGFTFGAQPVYLFVNGNEVRRDAWYEILPRAGDLIVVKARVAKGGGKNPLATILAIGLMIVAPMIGVAIAGELGLASATFFGISASTIIGGVVSIAGHMLINALFPPPRPTLSNAQNGTSSEAASPTYSLSGGSNRARPYDPLPLVLGSHRMFADYGAKFYTEFAGDDQYLYQVFHFGISDDTMNLVLSDFRIGNTPLGDFADVTTQTSDNTGALTLFPSNVDTIQGGALTYATSWVNKTSSVGATALAFDIQGQLFAQSNGALVDESVTIEGQYRLVGSGTWLGIFTGGATQDTLTSKTRKPLRKSYRLEVASGQYECRMRRLTADSVDAQRISDISWSQLRTYQPDTANYEKQRRVAVRIKASGQLQGTIEQFNALATSQCLTWNGSAWVVASTSNPAWLYLAFARGGTRDTRRAWGCSLIDARINLTNLIEFGAWCDAKTLKFDAIIDQKMNCLDVLNAIARCGRGSTSLASGKYGVVFDAPSQPVVQMFGLGNIKSGTFSVKWISEKLGDEVVLNFWNKDKDWQQDTVRARVPGVTSPTNPVTIELFGCVTADQAGREVNLVAAAQYYRRRFVTFETDFEGQVVTRGDVVALSHYLFEAGSINSWGYSGRLISGTTTQLLLDRTVTMSASVTNYVGVRFPDGTVHCVPVTYAGGAVSTITLATALPSSPDSDSLNSPIDYIWLFGLNATAGAKKFKVHECSPISATDVRVVLVDENPAYYTQESGTYDEPGVGAGATLPHITDIAVTENLLYGQVDVATEVNVTWETTGDYGGAQVTGDIDGTPLTPMYTTTNSVTFAVPSTGELSVSVTAFNRRGLTGPLSTGSTTYTLYAAATVQPKLVKYLLRSIGEPELVAQLAAPIDTMAGVHNGLANTQLKTVLDTYDLTNRTAWLEALTSAVITVDPVTGRISLLATANVTTDITARLTVVEVLLNATAATLSSTVSTLSTTNGNLTTTQAQVTLLAGQIVALASTVYVDDALGRVQGTTAKDLHDLAEAELRMALDNYEAQNNVRTLQGSVAFALSDLQTSATAFAAEVLARQALVAQVAGNTASITSTAATVVTLNSAQATLIDAISARLDSGDYAAVKILGDATASTVGGVTAKWGVQVQTVADGVRTMAGLQLLAGTDSQSVVAILADKFLIYKPDGTGAPIQVVTLGLINGVNTLGVNGNLFIDGSITTRHLAADSVLASKINVATLDEITDNAGVVVAGVLRNAANTNKVDLNATGTQNFFQVGSSAYVQANGAAYFNNIIVERQLTVATNLTTYTAGSYSITAGEGWKLLTTFTIDTGHAVGAWWAATDRTYSAAAGIANGSITVTSTGGFGTFVANWAVVVKRIYPKSRWVSTATIMLELELYAEVDGDSYSIAFPNASWSLFKVT